MKLIVPHLVKKFPAFCWTRRFITMFIRSPLRPSVRFHNKLSTYVTELADCRTYFALAWHVALYLRVAVRHMWHNTCMLLYAGYLALYFIWPAHGLFTSLRGDTIQFHAYSLIIRSGVPWSRSQNLSAPLPFPNPPRTQEWPSQDHACWCVSATHKFKNILPDGYTRLQRLSQPWCNRCPFIHVCEDP
jgi:hypothetical protein